jgi:hypothetical protein
MIVYRFKISYYKYKNIENNVHIFCKIYSTSMKFMFFKKKIGKFTIEYYYNNVSSTKYQRTLVQSTPARNCLNKEFAQNSTYL